MKIALTLCLVLFAIGVMTSPFSEVDNADSEASQETREQREKERNKWENFGADVKRGDQDPEYKRGDQDPEYKRDGSSQCDNSVNVWSDMKVYYAYCASEIKTAKVRDAFSKLAHVFSEFQFIDITRNDYDCTKIETEHHYIAVKNDGVGCWSYIGKTSGASQTLNLQTGSCESEGVIMHEVVHALGLYHTQQRGDRDNYITIYTDRIKSGKTGNFDTKDNMCTVCKYQTCSLMHYRAAAFSQNGANTIESKVPALNADMGKQTAVTAGDYCAIYLLYNLRTLDQCANLNANGDATCSYGTGNSYNFKCCKCPDNFEGEDCSTFKEVNPGDAEFVVNNDGSSVEVQSPHSQGSNVYPADKKITYFVRTDDACQLEMTPSQFDVEPDSTCYWDEVNFWNRTSVLDCPYKFCGKALLNSGPQVSESNFVMIKFKSDDMYNYKGFQLSFKAVNCAR